MKCILIYDKIIITPFKTKDRQRIAMLHLLGCRCITNTVYYSYCPNTPQVRCISCMINFDESIINI